MKILELALHAFGPFTDVVLDLSAGREGLHLIYGPNEAGKSSALRGLRQALFGIPAQSPDSFVHPYTKMRVGLTLRGGDGAILRFFRRKGNRSTLLAADGARRWPTGDLGKFLNGLSEAEFKSRFALDHEELVQGGKAILQGGGELGALLFQAGGGLKNLLEVQRELDRELEALFKPRGSKPRINAGLAELRAGGRSAKDVAAQRRVGRARAGEPGRRSRSRGGRAPAGDGPRREAPARAAQGGLALAGPAATRGAGAGQLGEVLLLSERFQKTRIEALSACESRLALTRERVGRGHRQARSRDRRAGRPRGAARRVARPSRACGKGWGPTARRGSPCPRKRRSCSRPCERPGPAGRARPGLPRAGRSRPARGDRAPEPAARTLPRGVDRRGEPLKLTRTQKTAIQKLASEQTRLRAEHEQVRKQLAELVEQLGRAGRAGGASPAAGDRLAGAGAGTGARPGRPRRRLEAARTRLALAEQQAARPCPAAPLDRDPRALDAARLPGGETIDRFEAEFAQPGRPAGSPSGRTADQVLLEQTEAEAALKRLLQAAGTVPSEDDLDRVPRRSRPALATDPRRLGRSRLPTAGGLGSSSVRIRLPAVSPKLLAG